MSTTVTVKQLAGVVNIPVELLLKQLQEAGIMLTDPDCQVTDEQKRQLLSYLESRRGSGDISIGTPQTITLKRKTVKELKVSGQKRKVRVEVRKRRVFQKPDEHAGAEGELSEEERLDLEAASADGEDQNLAVGEETAQASAAEQVVMPESASDESGSVEAASTPLPISEAAAISTEEAKNTKEKEKEKEKPKKHGKVSTEQEEQNERDRRNKKRGAPAEKTSTAGRFNRRELFSVGSQEEEGEEAGFSIGARRRRGGRSKRRDSAIQTQAFEKPMAPVIRDILIPENITVGELAAKMTVKVSEVIKSLMKMGVMATINEVIEQDTAILIADELGHKGVAYKEESVEDAMLLGFTNQTEATSRAPVVTIMGHVDHGKTSLLDYIRTTKVTAKEAGGITQHIGAYSVTTQRGKITFLDTPGHEAFTAMRARGAKSTDIVILVVAADDGVQPQTVEAIQHAKAGKVPIIVAINKMDKPGVDPERVKLELTNHQVAPEEWGGESLFVKVSAKSGQGVDELLDAVLLQSEMLELKAVVETAAQGVVIESRLDKGRGPVATILIQRGTLRRGDILLAGTEYGRVRAMHDEHGKQLDSAGPSTPVEVLGLSGTPHAGDEAHVMVEERKAREVAMFRSSKQREVRHARHSGNSATMEGLFDRIAATDVKVLNIILKADVQGSVEAIRESLSKLGTDEVKANVVAAAVGGITESDANLALASKAMIIGFNVRADNTARRIIEQEGLVLQYHSIIYDIIDDVKKILSGMLSPQRKEQIVGLAQVRDVFRSSKIGAIAGCMILEGLVKRNKPIRVLRDNVVIYQGELESLRRFKDDVSEVRQGMECGIGVKNYNDVKVGDQIEAFEVVEIARTV